MNRRIFLLFVGCLVACLSAAPSLANEYGPRRALLAGKNSGYVGPLDIAASPTGVYSVRAGSAAIAAAGTQPIVDLRRASDNATCTPIVATSGFVDLTVGTPCNSNTQTVTAWTNNDSSCTGAIATTTLTVASCTKGNLAVGLPITDANITAGTVITALGTGTGGAGTYTVNISQTAASAVFTAPMWAFVSKWYCQPSGCPDAAQATAGSQPILVVSGCFGSLPCLSFNGTSQFLSATISNVAQPISHSAVFVPVNQTSFVNGITSNGILGPATFYNASFNFSLYAGSINGSIALSQNSSYAMQALFNGAASKAELNGALTTGLSPGTAASSTTFTIGARSNASNFGPIELGETGMWPSDTSALWTALTANQRSATNGFNF